MGQPITVAMRGGAAPNVRFFECNRSLTGMAIEVYTADSEAAASGSRPPDVLARRLLEAGAVKVTIYSNVVTVEAPPDAWAELEPKVVHTIEHLFEFYGDEAGWSFEARGVEPEVSKIQ
jgi:Scaffold protein Nfu/NifU N terminal